MRGRVKRVLEIRTCSGVCVLLVARIYVRVHECAYENCVRCCNSCMHVCRCRVDVSISQPTTLVVLARVRPQCDYSILGRLVFVERQIFTRNIYALQDISGAEVH